MLKGIKSSEAAEALGVGYNALNTWERGFKNPTIENLEKMADIYGVSVDYLLGRDFVNQETSFLPISPNALPALHGMPAWSAQLGWVIIDAINRQIVTVNAEKIPFENVQSLYMKPDYFSYSDVLPVTPIKYDNLNQYDEVLVEPVSTDQNLRKQLRGRYRVKSGYVENSIGNRFFFDTYELQWLAFEIK